MTTCVREFRKRVANAALFVVCGFAALTASSATWADTMRRETLILISAGGRTEILTEIALTGPEQEQGLMFRTGMAENAGMLFIYEQTHDLSMWMRNTYLPLDMVFMRADGTIARIEASAEPLSDRVIASGSPVKAVLELKAGTAQRLGLKPGDRVDSPSLKAAAP